MILSLDVLKARKGDCLILHYGTKENPAMVLIDGGPSKVYRPFLKPRLDQIKKSRGLAANEPLLIDLLMVSHIDEDHLQGLIDLTKELVDAKDSQRPLPYEIKRVWHNTIDEITDNNAGKLVDAVTASFGTAALTGEPDLEGLDPVAAMVLAGIAQGYRLRDDVRKLKVNINPEFGGQLIMAKKGAKPVKLNRNLKLYLVGPMEPELLKLQKDFEAYLKEKQEKKGGKQDTAIASFTDTSVPNLSSLVVLAEMKGKSILLTGDARGDKILEGLEMIGKLKMNGIMHVDILKMPHHGSDRNLDPIFFRRITADHYVFSGNGEHGNPERSTLQMLLDECGDKKFTIHLTYPVQEIDTGRKEDWEKEQQKEKKRKEKKSSTQVRMNWSNKKHSLASFLEEHADFAKKISIINEDESRVIDLFDEVGF